MHYQTCFLSNHSRAHDRSMFDGSFEQTFPCAMSPFAKSPDSDRKLAPAKSWRTWVPRTANLLLWLLFSILSASGFLLAFRLPPGSRGGHGLSVLGRSRHEWGDLHLWISCAFLVLVLVHLCLHWRWFWQVVGKRRAWPILLGIVTGLLLIISAFFIPVEGGKHIDRKKSSMDGPSCCPPKPRNGPHLPKNP